MNLFERLFKRPSAAAKARAWAIQPRPPRPLNDSDGPRAREPERELDRALTSTAQRWLASLPSGLRPTHLCSRHPRLANKLALCWRDPALVEQVLDELMVDRRLVKRKGFAPIVAQELLRLHEFSARRPVADKGDRWDRRVQAVNDR